MSLLFFHSPYFRQLSSVSLFYSARPLGQRTYSYVPGPDTAEWYSRGASGDRWDGSSMSISSSVICCVLFCYFILSLTTYSHHHPSSPTITHHHPPSPSTTHHHPPSPPSFVTRLIARSSYHSSHRLILSLTHSSHPSILQGYVKWAGPKLLLKFLFRYYHYTVAEPRYRLCSLCSSCSLCSLCSSCSLFYFLFIDLPPTHPNTPQHTCLPPTHKIIRILLCWCWFVPLSHGKSRWYRATFGWEKWWRQSMERLTLLNNKADEKTKWRKYKIHPESNQSPTLAPPSSFPFYLSSPFWLSLIFAVTPTRSSPWFWDRKKKNRRFSRKEQRKISRTRTESYVHYFY